MARLADSTPGGAGLVHLEVARQVLDRAGEDEQIHSLALALHSELRRARAVLGMGGAPPDQDCAGREQPDAPGLLWLDELAARILEDLGHDGRKKARMLRRNAAARWVEHAAGAPAAKLWHLWLPVQPGAPCRFAFALCTALWARMEAEQKSPPHLTQGVVLPLLTLMRPSTSVAVEGRGPDCHGVLLHGATAVGELDPDRVDQAARRELRRNGHRGGRPRVNVDLRIGVYDDAMLAMLAAQHKAMKTAVGLRAFREIVRQGHRLKNEHRQSPPVCWNVTWRELADLAGAAHGKDEECLRLALNGLSTVRMPVRGDERNGSVWLLNIDDYPARGNRPDRLVITVNHPLLPGYHWGLEKGRYRFYVPVPLLPPPFVGGPALRGREMLLQQDMFLLLSEKSAEAVENGGWEITARDWQRLAAECEVPARTMPRIREAYLAPSAGLVPILTSVNGKPGLFSLSEAYAVERDLLLRQGRLRLARAAGGRTGAAVRRRRRGGRPRKVQQ